MPTENVVKYVMKDSDLYDSRKGRVLTFIRSTGSDGCTLRLIYRHLFPNAGKRRCTPITMIIADLIQCHHIRGVMVTKEKLGVGGRPTMIYVAVEFTSGEKAGQTSRRGVAGTALEEWLGYVFTERQKRLIRNAQLYALNDPAGLPGHNLMLIIDTFDQFVGLLAGHVTTEELQECVTALVGSNLDAEAQSDEWE